MPFTHTNPAGGGSFALSGAGNSSSPVAADRNPYLDPDNAGGYIDGANDQEEAPSWDAANSRFIDNDLTRNTAAHSREGQNVVYLDTHVEFEKLSNCGINNDNIWIPWVTTDAARATQEEKELGDRSNTGLVGCTLTGTTTLGPVSFEDAFLVNECAE